MATRKIFKTGHSLAVTLSAAMLTKAGLKEGDTVGVEFDEQSQQIVIAPKRAHAQLTFQLKSRPKLGSKPHA